MTRSCPCGKTFQPKVKWQAFCSLACRRHDRYTRTVKEAPRAAATKPCAAAGCPNLLTKRVGESVVRWAKRVWCGVTCANRAAGMARTKAAIARAKVAAVAPAPKPAATPKRWTSTRPPCPASERGGHHLVQEAGLGAYAPFTCVKCGYVFEPPDPKEQDWRWPRSNPGRAVVTTTDAKEATG